MELDTFFGVGIGDLNLGPIDDRARTIPFLVMIRPQIKMINSRQ
jgi:hypothetical protein